VSGASDEKPDARALLREHGSFVWRVLRHLGVAEDQLDDLSQEVLIVLLSRWQAFEGRSSLRTFLYGICRNVARSARRQRRARQEVALEHAPEPALPGTPESALRLRQDQARLVEALAQLDETQRMIFILYEIEEFSMEEIARELGAPIRTCYSRLEVAREHVAARFRRGERFVSLRKAEVLE
jgi:RNA polymerase sigma-70 factor, ECF subfamily